MLQYLFGVDDKLRRFRIELTDVAQDTVRHLRWQAQMRWKDGKNPIPSFACAFLRDILTVAIQQC